MTKKTFNKSKRLIGAHLSTAGGVDKAVERAHAIGANCLQVFSGSPRMWRRTSLEKIDKEKIFAKQKELGVAPIFTHALYLVNLASDKPELVEKSVMALKHDMEFDSFVKGAGVVVHLGSHQGRGWEEVREQVADLIMQILAETPTDSKFLVENSAGQKGKLCSDFGEIRWLLDTLEERSIEYGVWGSYKSRIGWCFDTCHGFAAGYLLSMEYGVWGIEENAVEQAELFGGDKSDEIKPKFALEEIEKLKLFETLSCIHVNDSKDPFRSGRDRHANIGEGEISQEDLRSFLNDERVRGIPLVTEVPGADKKGPDEENAGKIRELATK